MREYKALLKTVENLCETIEELHRLCVDINARVNNLEVNAVANTPEGRLGNYWWGRSTPNDIFTSECSKSIEMQLTGDIPLSLDDECAMNQVKSQAGDCVNDDIYRSK